ncbi:hypothetical protein SEA_WEISS13_8 [Mycobacterium phage Weiss13]|uniref:Uncharacterized protein n=1 Tax=Mycobacterium phage Weiss13 TaxID=1784843 RepID=A0A109QIJ0_9CAUD|nr:hypothetical protein SEA_WEISS13_8 [Mycobacterium phage Weiss13]
MPKRKVTTAKQEGSSKSQPGEGPQASKEAPGQAGKP